MTAALPPPAPPAPRRRVAWSIGLVVLSAAGVAGCSPTHPDRTKDTSGKETTFDTGLDSAVETGDSVPDSPVETATHTGETGESDTVPDSDSAEPPPCDRSLPWTYVAAGFEQTCGIHADGCAECWGIGEGDDSFEYEYHGEDKPPPAEYESIAMTASSKDGFGMHACGLLVGGGTLCWGRNLRGETDAPTTDFVEVKVAGFGSFGRTADGTIEPWGDANMPFDTAVTAFAVGESEALAVGDDGRIGWWIWTGDGFSGWYDGSYSEVAIAGEACALTTVGEVVCWSPESQSPGTGTSDEHVFDEPAGTYNSLCMAGRDLACVLDAEGYPTCWGADFWGVTSPPTDTAFTQLACGRAHVCGLTAEGSIVCWGENDYGQNDVPT